MTVEHKLAARRGGLNVNTPILSVTITNYNYARFLEQNLDSILSQTFADFEVIVVDNASTDDSVSILRRYSARDSRIRLIKHTQNVGRFESLREACDLARGRYRVHVDADDFVLSPDAFRQQLALLESNPAITLVFSAMTLVDGADRVLHVSHPYNRTGLVPAELALETLLTFNVNHSGMMHRMDALRSTPGYTEAYPNFCDALLAVRLSEHGQFVGFINQSLYAFRQHGSNLSSHPELQIIRHEVLPVVGVAFAGPLGARLQNAPAVKRRVTRNNLVHFPTQFIFSGQPRIGWRMYWESIKLDPYATIFQRRTLSLLARTLLGAFGYQQLLTRLPHRG